MKPAVQWLEMQQAVLPVEVKPAPDRDEQQQGDEPGRVAVEGDQRGITVGVGPEQPGFP